MCLIVFAYQVHPDYPLIVLANRDEFYQRPTRAAQFWPETPTILAGKDLQSGGTWLGVSKAGRFAAVTNFREKKTNNSLFKSRGEIPINFLSSEISSEQYCQNLVDQSEQYDGYNALLFDGKKLCYASNKITNYKTEKHQMIKPGVYGISNHLFDTPWPKVLRSKKALQKQLTQPVDIKKLFTILADDTKAQDHELPDTGIGFEFEQLLSSCFIKSPQYGTRSSTIILYNKEKQIQFYERCFGVEGIFSGEKTYEFIIEKDVYE